MATTSNPANMDVPISKIYIRYLIDAAEKTFKQDFYYISYMLLKEAEKTVETLKEQGSTEYSEGLESGIRELLSLVTNDATKEDPVGYAGKTTIGKLVLFYSEYKEMFKISTNQELTGEYETREDILTTSKALRTALKMLSRVAPQDRTKIPEEGPIVTTLHSWNLIVPMVASLVYHNPHHTLSLKRDVCLSFVDAAVASLHPI